MVGERHPLYAQQRSDSAQMWQEKSSNLDYEGICWDWHHIPTASNGSNFFNAPSIVNRLQTNSFLSCAKWLRIDMWRQDGKWSFSYSIFKFLSVRPCTHECSAVTAHRSLPGVLRITGSDIFPLCTVRRQAIIEYQVHKLLFNLTCVLEAINTCGAVGAA